MDRHHHGEGRILWPRLLPHAFRGRAGLRDLRAGQLQSARALLSLDIRPRLPSPEDQLRIRHVQDLRDRVQHRSMPGVSHGQQLHAVAQVCGGPRPGTQRLLQEQCLLRAHRPPNDREGAPPRQSHPQIRGGVRAACRRRVSGCRDLHRGAFRYRPHRAVPPQEPGTARSGSDQG